MRSSYSRLASLSVFAVTQVTAQDFLDTLTFTQGLWKHSDPDNQDYQSNLNEVFPEDGADWSRSPSYLDVAYDICN